MRADEGWMLQGAASVRVPAARCATVALVLTFHSFEPVSSQELALTLPSEARA